MALRAMPLRRATAITLCGLMAGCAVGPNYHSPPAPRVSRYTPDALPVSTIAAETPGGGAQTFQVGEEISGDWWTLFKSPELSRLVTEALKANPDVAAAKAGLRVAHENYLAQWGALLPSAEASYNVTRQQASGTPAAPLASNDNLFTLHTAQITVSYAPDVFGGIRRQVEAAKAQETLARDQAEAAYLTLTSNVVLTAIQEA